MYTAGLSLRGIDQMDSVWLFHLAGTSLGAGMLGFTITNKGKAPPPRILAEHVQAPDLLATRHKTDAQTRHRNILIHHPIL